MVIHQKNTPGLWKNNSNDNTFGLIVNDFAAKYIGRENSQHLVNALKDKHEDVDVNWEGDKLCGINLKWNYDSRTCKLNLKGCIDNLHKRFDTLLPTKPQLAPADHTTPAFDQRQQFVK